MVESVHGVITLAEPQGSATIRGVQMHYVVLASHSAEVCPTSNAKTKAVLLEVAPQMNSIAEKHGVNILAGPYASHEHTVVTIVEVERPEGLDAFLTETRLPQWNQVRILPSVPVEEAMKELEETTTMF
jgi:uncharacterized protein with GYD domain